MVLKVIRAASARAALLREEHLSAHGWSLRQQLLQPMCNPNGHGNGWKRGHVSGAHEAKIPASKEIRGSQGAVRSSQILDRTQEVAGSSPASSIRFKRAPVSMTWCGGPNPGVAARKGDVLPNDG